MSTVEYYVNCRRTIQCNSFFTEGPLLPVALLPDEFLAHTQYAQV